MDDLLMALAQHAVAAAKSAGADDVFATCGRSRSVDMSVRDGAVESVKEATSSSLSIRLWVDGRYGTHRTNDLREDKVTAFVADAVALSRAVQQDAFRQVTDPSLFAGRADVDLELSDPSVRALTREDRLALCNTQNDAVRGKEGVISATSSVSDSAGSSAMASSNGFVGRRDTSSLWIGSEVTMRDKGDKKPEGWMWGGGRHKASMPDPVKVAQLALERTMARLGSVKGPTAKTLMVVDPAAAASILRRLLGPARAGSIQQKRSFYADKIGKKLVSDKLSIVDDPLRKRGLASRLYDNEGISCKAMPIIEAGVLRNVYVDTYYGKKLGMAPNTGGSTNVVVAPGERSLAQILADAPHAVYVTSWLGGNADSTTGDFSLGLRGHVVKDGKMGGPVGEMNITGDLLGLFSQLVEVGNDPWPYSSTLAPTLVFDGVDFAGA